MKTTLWKTYSWPLLVLISALQLLGCNATVSDNKVEVLSKGAQEGVTFKVVGGEEKGEFLVGGAAVNFEIEVKNNATSFLSDMVLEVNPLATAAMKFAPNPDGKSDSPGFGGNCTSILLPGATCRYVVEFKPTFSGNLKQDFLFRYKNLIQAEEARAEITLLAGEAASLIFEGERINYDLGVLERTEPAPIVTNLRMTNVGGLTARNLIFGQLDSHASQPFRVTQNNCPASLSIGQGCDMVVVFTPQNFGLGAPDGDNDIQYTSNIRYDYVREPGGGLGALTAFFAVNSTKIRGQMDATGLAEILFDDQTVGNKQSKLVKIINNGFKESILHHVDVYNAANTHVARCSKFSGNNDLTCQDPADTGVAGTNLTLEQFPLRVNDTLGCLIDYTDIGYTRNPDGSLSNPGLRDVGGRTVALPGESCLFDLTFQPSVAYLSGGNINGYQVKFVYDSTWKNTIDIQEDTYGTGPYFTITEAEWDSAALLAVNNFELGARTFTDIDPDTADDLFLFDLGRVALVSDPTYSERLRVIFRNNGSTDAEIVSVRDGGVFNFGEIAADINSYYQSAAAINCGILNKNGGECNISMNLIPLASSNPDSFLAEEEENNAMYDVRSGYPEQYKTFYVEYKDGSTYEDDGVTPTANKVLVVRVRSLLVRKGFLVFEDNSPDQGLNQQMVRGEEIYFFIKLKNAGTGGIPYITTMPGFDLVRPTTGNAQQPYEFVDRIGAEDGADKDCYDFLTRLETAPAVMPPLTNAAAVLNAGETCSLAVRMKMRSVDLMGTNQYNGPFRFEWNRSFSDELQNTLELWDYNNTTIQNNTVDTTFSYYDGDGIPNVATGHSPDLDGYGNYFAISGGNAGLYSIGINANEEGRLIPRDPLPALNGVICRQQLNLPLVNPDPINEWGLPFPADVVPERCIDAYGEDFDELAAKSPLTRDKIMLEENSYDYVYYAGTWETGGSYDIGFVIEKMGGPAGGGNLEVVSSSYTGDTTELALNDPLPTTFNDRTIGMTFNPTTDGDFETTLYFEYKSGLRRLDDVDNLTYSDVTRIFRIKIRADSVSTIGSPRLDVQDFLVTYDPDTTLVDDTALDGAPYNLPLYFHNTNPSEKAVFRAIRSGEVYAKKRLTITNNGSGPLNDLNFNMKESPAAGGYSNTFPGSGITVDSNTCVGANLLPTQTCEAIIIFNAGPFEAGLREAVVDITYQMTTDTYQQENAILRFEARDPAILDVAGINDENIEDTLGNIIPDSYPINLGFYGVGHPIVNLYPTHRYGRLNVGIDNISTEKASFLAQWENENGSAPLPGTPFVSIYNSGGIEVEASRGCFYGDDEPLAIDEDTKGFNSATAIANRCRMNFYYDLDDTFFGEEIEPAQANFRLYYYNNERASSDYIPFHFKGFVEGNRSQQSDSALSSVETLSSGSISFAWEPATPLQPAWGPVVGYRVFYSQNKAALNDIFNPALFFVDTTDPEVTINGVAAQSYYYLKVVARRESTQSGKIFLSDTGMPTQTVIVPPSGFFYDYDLEVMVGQSMSSTGGGFGTKSEAQGFCASEQILMVKNGSTTPIPLKLIDSNIYDLIDSDPSLSNYPYKAVPHWMNDAPVNIAGIFDPFDCSAQSGSDGSITFYQKTCADCSCNNLSLFVGGDGSDLPFGAKVYADGEAFDAAVRCYLEQ